MEVKNNKMEVEFLMKCLWTKYEGCRNYDYIKYWYHKVPDDKEGDYMLVEICKLCLLAELSKQIKLFSARSN